MTLKLNSKKLLTALNLCAKAVNQNGVLATSCYRLHKTERDVLGISACNMEISITSQVECSSMDMCDILISAKDLDVVKTFADQSLEFTFTENAKNDEIFYDILLTSANGKYKMQGYDGSNFPVITTKDAEPIELDFADLQIAINRTAYTRLADTTENALNGLSVEFSDKGIDFVAFNGISFALYNISGEYGDAKHILPPGIVSAIMGLGITGKCMVKFSDNSITIHCEPVTIKSLLLGGKFIDWKPLLKIPEYHTLVNRVELINAIRRVLMFSDKFTQAVAICIYGDILTVKGEDINFAKGGNEVMKCADAEPINIGVNGMFAIEALSKLDCDGVYLFYSTYLSPLLFRESLDSVNKSLLAPIKI